MDQYSIILQQIFKLFQYHLWKWMTISYQIVFTSFSKPVLHIHMGLLWTPYFGPLFNFSILIPITILELFFLLLKFIMTMICASHFHRILNSAWQSLHTAYWYYMKSMDPPGDSFILKILSSEPKNGSLKFLR